MEPNHLPRLEQAIIDLLKANAEALLLTERHIRNRDIRFTGEQLAEKLGVPKEHAMAFLRAFSQLPFDRFEIDGDTIRHV